MNQLSDHQIVEFLQSGNSQAQNTAMRQLYKDYYRMIAKLVLDNSGSDDSVKEIFQNGIIVFFNKVKQSDFELNSTCKTFLYAICKNLWLSELRKNKRQTPLQTQHQEIASEENIAVSLEVTEQQQLLLQLLEKTGDECKKILLRYYYYRLRIKQIQEELNLTSEQVVKNKKGKCIAKLRKMIADNPGYEKMLK
ncbi:MAG: RNA polymerase sigma factor (sigma-70 family) [Paraglaciecola sp.]|jgi:RNA polymerase sigma factor (sigma-70 family)